MSVPVEGPGVNNFEKVYSDGHKMSLAGGLGPAEFHVQCLGGAGTRWDPMSDVQGLDLEVGLYSEIQCITSDGHMGIHFCEQTDTTEDITSL